MKSPALVLLLFAFSASAQDPKPVAAAPAPDSTAAAPCVILKRMGPADEITSHLYSFGIRGKQFQYIEGTLPQGISFHGRLTDHDARKILDKGGKIQILEPKYAQADIEAARRQMSRPAVAKYGDDCEGSSETAGADACSRDRRRCRSASGCTGSSSR